MPRRRYTYSHHRRNTDEPRRRRNGLMRPGVQISVLLVVGLIIFLLLQSAR